MMKPPAAKAAPVRPDQLYDTLKAADVRQASYVPDAGHARLIERLRADPAVKTTVLTTEEEGIALSAGEHVPEVVHQAGHCELIVVGSPLGQEVGALEHVLEEAVATEFAGAGEVPGRLLEGEPEAAEPVGANDHR